ncbi:MAG: nitric oxide synthase oxygenase [Myxococcota bacterium]
MVDGPVHGDVRLAPERRHARVRGRRERARCAVAKPAVRLRPAVGAPTPSLPGQYIVLQGRIHGRWATRAYTLTSRGGAAVPYEINVKREEMGLFSRWLSDYADHEALLRCSQPMGDVFLGADETGPVYAFAAGIGITPGLALARTLSVDGTGRTVHIDWSARSHDDFESAYELEALSLGRFVSWTRRCTSTDGRLDAATLAERYPYQEGALAFVCGPDAYMERVREWLVAAGWPAGSVRVEVFSSNVDVDGHVGREDRAEREVVDLTDAEVVPYDSFALDLRPDRPVLREAEIFLAQMYRELGLSSVLEGRLAEVRAEIAETGTYVQTADELSYGARLAWRNSSRCIGRFFWNHLQVRDMRHLETEEEMFEAIVDHMRLATNEGDLVSTLTVFRPGEPTIRLWNGQLVRYAGYRQPDGKVIGDPANCELTERIQALGWKAPGGRFDVLPLVLQIGDRAPKYFEIPPDAVMEVEIEHPDLPWFAELGLRWYVLPAVSELVLDSGGVQYRCVPFNGFYMVTEIGARNFSDESRYDLLPVIADKMGLDRRTTATLWKDRALVELNVAVMHSFQKKKVRMQDHHAMSTYFEKFEEQETACKRPVYADWSWLVPPMSGSTSSIFLRDDLQNVVLKPMYAYQKKAWEEDRDPDHEGPVPPCPYHRRRAHG